MHFERLEKRDMLAVPPSLSMLEVPKEQSTYGLTGTGYAVAIIDTGIDQNNPAFAGRIIDGWNFITNTSDFTDDNGHGTHVAGIIGSHDQNFPGIAPDVNLVILKVLDKTGTGTFDNVNKALEWIHVHAKQDNIVAVNMSFGDGNFQTGNVTISDNDLKALATDNIFMAAAAGNSFFADASKPGLAYPASSQYVVSVGAVWNGEYGPADWANGAKDFVTYPDKIASFTQRDTDLDLLAPGAYVISTYLNDSFAALAGTSMASPMVAAEAVLVKQAMDKAGRQQDILPLLQKTGISVNDADLGQDNVIHTGLTFQRIDVFNAIDSILHDLPTPDEKFVTNLYLQVLDRQVDAGGLSYWTQLLATSISRFEISAAIWSSAEHQQILQSADYFYELLGRDPEPSASQYFNSIDRSKAVDIIMESPEYIRHLYEQLLGREPGDSEINYWINSKLNPNLISELFLSSQEFYDSGV